MVLYLGVRQGSGKELQILAQALSFREKFIMAVLLLQRYGGWVSEVTNI